MFTVTTITLTGYDTPHRYDTGQLINGQAGKFFGIINFCYNPFFVRTSCK